MALNSVPSDAHLHDELNHHGRQTLFKEIFSCLRTTQKATDVIQRAGVHELSPAQQSERQRTLAAIDRKLRQVASILAEE